MTPQHMETIKSLAASYPTPGAAVLGGLQVLQGARGGYLTDDDLTDVAAALRVPLSTVEATCSYYSMLRRTPVGKYHLQLDTNLPALLAGADALLDHLQRALGIQVGETTKDGLFTLSTVEDLGSCGTCPVLQVNDRYYENLTPAKVDQLLASLRKGVLPDARPEGHFGSECNILLARRGKGDPGLAGYVKDGGYQGLAKALAQPPADVQKAVKDAMLRGRGGAGFPAGLKWGFIPKDNAKPVYLICNADEGEPGTFKDRQIMEHDPHLLLEGMAIAGYAIGARLGYVYIRGEFAWIADLLERAVAEARKAGKLGPDAHGKGVGFDVRVVRGAGAYVCGEETALIESLEGKRGNPRLRPPYPAVSGLFGCPTIVNNVETLACVPYILREGVEAFRKIGTPNNFGPKIFGVSGHVNRPGTYEFPLGTPLAKVLEAAGGVKGHLKAIIVGGLSVPILTAAESASLVMDYDSCIKAGTMLGSGGIMVMNDTVSLPRMALRAIRFYAHESCGQCTPCRQGSLVIEQLLHRVVEGHGRSADLDHILSLCSTIKGSTLCPTGDAFAMPIEAMIKKFRPEFERLCAEGGPHADR